MKSTLVWDKEQEAYVIGEGESEDSSKAELEQAGMLAGISRIEVGGVPIGAAAAGGGVAFLVDYAVDRFLPQVTGSMANLLAAWALVNWGSRWLGADVARFGAIFLAYEAIRDPIENLLGKVLPARAAQIRQEANLGGGFKQHVVSPLGIYAGAL